MGNVDNIIELLQNLNKTRQRIKEVEYELNVLKDEAYDYEQELRTLLDDADIQSFSHGNLMAYRRDDIYASVKRDKFEEAKKWLFENGYSDIVKETVNARSLTSVLKEKMEEDGSNAAIPDSLFNLTLKKRVIIKSKRS